MAIATKEKTKTRNKETKTQPAKPTETRKWFLVDVEDKVVGRVSTRIATLLMGKGKSNWVPYLDKGDYVVVTNASKIRFTGNKNEAKIYYRYSGYPGGLKEETAKHLRERKPTEIVFHAVRGMLPKTRLGRAMIKKLYVYPGTVHPHEGQKPEKLDI